MFSKILGRKKEDIGSEDPEHRALVEKISTMNLTEMRSYVNDKIKEFALTEDGLVEVMNRLILEDKKTKELYIKSDDMDSKKKKAFDLVLSIAKNKKISLVAIEQIQKFIIVYKDIIEKYDQDNKEIYASRFVDVIKFALASIAQKAALKNKMDLLGENK